jgi:zinc transport system substrate-binding protein
MLKKIIIIFLVLIFGLFIFTQINKKEKTESLKLKVITSIYPIEFLTREIAQGKIEVINIIPANTEAHSYEPTSQDIIKISESSLLLANGLGMEPWLSKIEKNTNTKIVILGGDLAYLEKTEDGHNHGHSHEGEHEEMDPHIWLSPTLAIKMAEKINNALAEIDTENKDFYQENFLNLKNKLEQLDTDYKNGLSFCEKNKIVTAHAAFGYMAKEYGFKQIPIKGLTPEEEPTLKKITELSKTIKDNNLSYVFLETLSNPQIAQMLAKENNTGTLTLNPLEGLTKEDISLGKNYFTEMQNNLKNITIALECKT